MQFTKPTKSYEEQADILLSRGIAHTEESKNQIRTEIISRLRDVGYYRLSGYWYPFMRDNQFQPNVTFQMIWQRYTFDRQLRLCVLDAIERVEIFFRDTLSMEIASRSGPFGYQYPQNLPGMNQQQHSNFLHCCEKNFHRSKELFATHFKESYGDSHTYPPIWMTVELLTFGSLVSLYKGASKEIRTKIAEEIGVPASVLLSWLKTLNDVRNICAHHSRLWNREFGRSPKIPRNWSSSASDNRRLFSTLTILAYLLKIIAPTSKLFDRFMKLLDHYPDLPLQPMGFPPDWTTESCWSTLCSRYSKTTGNAIRNQ